MRCPFCNHPEDKVIDSRESKEGESIRRRRECEKCARRFTTYERIDEIPYMVVKKDGRREKFDRQKVMQGLVKASEKRPISMGKLAAIIDDVETRLSETQDRELSTVKIGELLMENLKALDKIAYVRFASVYRDFQDVDAFLREVSDLMKHKRT
jgi:transcriptional repressor NrdR